MPLEDVRLFYPDAIVTTATPEVPPTPTPTETTQGEPSTMEITLSFSGVDPETAASLLAVANGGSAPVASPSASDDGDSGSDEPTRYTQKQLQGMARDELIAAAESAGVEVVKGQKGATIIKNILAAYEEADAEDSEEEADDADDDWEDDEEGDEEEEKPKKGKAKAKSKKGKGKKKK